MAEKLVCVGRYVNEPAGLAYEVGQVFVVSSRLRDFLMADAPGCFEDYVPPPVRPRRKRARVRNKAVQTAPVDKGDQKAVARGEVNDV